MAAWCPYCQKVWLLLEEKRIPYKLSKINMRSYGDKPGWFLDKVPNGLLPAIEVDGQFMTDSLPIMQVLDATFDEPGTPMMVPPAGPERERASELLRLERELFSAWCQLTFQPGKGLMDRNERIFLGTLARVDAALGETSGPWFLESEHPTLVDLQYVSHVERMLASAVYWKGLQLRGTGDFPNLDTWLAAFEERPSYLATKSDYYTHCQDIPPQYGPGFSVDDAKEARETIDGVNGAWALPLSPSALEPLAPLQAALGDEAARHEAAFELVSNHEAVVKFAARGVGAPGQKRFQAPLADPYATPAEGVVDAVDVCLRHVAAGLVHGADEAEAAAAADLKAVAGGDGGRSLVVCLGYLRDRIGVPRDMSQPAAMHLRAQLNAVISML